MPQRSAIAVAALAAGLCFWSTRSSAESSCPLGPDDLINTYSVLGYDPETKDVGIAIASRVFNVSSFYGKAGVGVIALQHSFSGQNLLTAVEGVELMEMGFSAADAIEMLMSKDAGKDFRQMGAVDAKGRVAAFTGPECTYYSGDRQGKHHTGQGNMLTGKETVDALVETFDATQGELADKLMAALLQADTIGGDARGKQSAALRVYRTGSSTEASTTVGADVEPMSHYVDLRVMDHDEPVKELNRLWKKRKDFRMYAKAVTLAREGKKDEAVATAKEFIRLYPEESSAYESLGLVHYRSGDKDEAIRWFREAAKHNPRYEQLWHMRLKVIRDRAGTLDPFSAEFKDDPDFTKTLFGK
jgi:uncharacterized Ntn-hydrolase superfamily protein